MTVFSVRGCILIAQRDDSDGDKRGGRTQETVVDIVNETRREVHYQASRHTRALFVYAASFEHAQMGSYPWQSAKRMHIDSRRFCRPDLA